LREALQHRQDGSILLAAAQTGQVRVASFRWARGYPLAVVVAMDESQPDGLLQRRRSGYLWAAAALTVVVALIVSMGLKRSRSRTGAEGKRATRRAEVGTR